MMPMRPGALVLLASEADSAFVSQPIGGPGNVRFDQAARAIEHGVAAAMREGRVTKDVGGSLGTTATAHAIVDFLRSEKVSAD